MTGSRAAKWWLLSIAVVSGLTGLVLKASELVGARNSTTPAAPPAGRTMAEARRHREPASPGSEAPGRGVESNADEVNAPPGVARDGPHVPPSSREGGHGEVRGEGDGGAGEHLGRDRLGSSRAPVRAHGQRRGNAQGSLQAGSVGVGSGAVGQAAPPRMGPSPMHPGQLAWSPPGAAAPEPGSPPEEVQNLPPDVAFQSRDDDQYAVDAQVEIPDVGKVAGQAGTLSFWLQPQWGQGNQDDATLVQLGDLQIMKNVHYLRFEAAEDSGLGGLGAPIDGWKAGEWHQITATWNGSEMSLYLDGQFVGRTINDAPVDIPPDAKLFLGSDFPQGRPVAPGMIEQVYVRNRVLTPAEVAMRYLHAVGANN